MSPISVVVCTRNRPDWSRRVSETGLAQLEPGDEMIVVDQSDGDDTQLGLDAISSGGRLRCLRSFRHGLSAARNDGIVAAANEIVVFIDDDCVPADDWMGEWRRVWACWGQEVGVAFGTVLCAPFDPLQGWIGGFEAHDGIYGREIFRRSSGAVGIGASLAVRRSLALEVGGFDEVLGTGAYFGAGEELDFAYRIVRSGRLLAHASAPRVWHYGFRPTAAARTLVQRYRFGTAAAFAKHCRCGDSFAALVLVHDLWLLVRLIAGQAVHRRRPLGLRSLRAYLRGIAAGWAHPLDTSTCLYLETVARQARENPGVAEVSRS